MAERAENVTLPPAAPPSNHGHTLAAWFAMTAVMVGAAVAGVGVAVATGWVVVAGAVVVAVGLLGGGVLRTMGYGQRTVRR